jgi:hypothetical protein
MTGIFSVKNRSTRDVFIIITSCQMVFERQGVHLVFCLLVLAEWQCVVVCEEEDWEMKVKKLQGKEAEERKNSS